MPKPVLKKGQIGIMETIMVLVPIVILIIIGIFVYFKFFYETIEETGEKLEVQKFSVLLSSFSSLPEVRYSGDLIGRDFVDVVKLYVVKEAIEENKEYYIDLFGFRRIYIEQVYPAVDGVCEREDFRVGSECGKWEIYDNNPKGNRIVSMPVSLYFSETDEYKIGRLVIVS